MEDYEMEQLRRSITMLPPGHTSGALTKQAAERLLAELEMLRSDNARFRRALVELRESVDTALR